MERSVISGEGVIVIAPEGELDVSNSSQLKEMLDEEISEGRRKIVIDLKEVGYVDSSALGVLVSGLKEMRRLRGSLKLAHLSEGVDKIFQLTRLSRFFEIYGTVEDALQSFRSNGNSRDLVRSG